MPQANPSVWRSFAIYCAILCALTLPFWIAGYMVEASPLRGLSVSAFAIVVPMVSAAITVFLEGGWAAVRALFSSGWRSGHHRLAIAAIAIAVPTLAAVASWWLAPGSARDIGSPLFLVALIPALAAGAIGEEIGWSSFASARLAGPVGIPLAGLVIGAVWAVWHYPSLIELGHSPEWIMWWSVWSIGQRVIMVLLYVRGSNWIAGPVLYHVASNLVWQAAVDAFDPRVEAIVTVAAAILLLVAFRQPEPHVVSDRR